MIKLKYIAPCLVLSLLAAGKLAAQIEPPVPTPFDVVGGPVSMQANPQSEEYKRTAERFDNDVDDYLDVNNWGGVAENMPRYFLFGHYDLGTPAGIATLEMSKVSLGFATKLQQNYLALYYEGFINRARGWNKDETGALSESFGGTQNTDKLALFYARDSIGAIRLDILLSDFLAGALNGPGDQSKSTNNNGFGATVQWGKNFELPIGTFKPNVAVGFLLPSSYSDTNKGNSRTISGVEGELPPGYYGSTFQPGLNGYYITTTDGITVYLPAGDGLIYGAVGLDLARDVWEFSVNYDLYADLGYSSKTDGVDGTKSRDGQFWHIVSLAAQRNWNITDKLATSIKPALNLGFYTWDGVYKPGNASFNYGDYFGFELQPTLDLGVKYQLKETVSLYGGTSITLLDWKTASKSRGDTLKRGSRWEVDNIVDPSINVGFTWTPIPALAVEFGLDVDTVNNFIDWIPTWFRGDDTWKNLQLGVGLLVRYKPQAKSASAAFSASAAPASEESVE